MRSSSRLVASLVTVALLAFGTSSGATTLPRVGWVPNTIAAPPYSAGALPPYLHLTRRIVADPHVPGRFVVGHYLYGLYESMPGVGLTPLTLNCFGVPWSPPLSTTLAALPACGVEGLAFDPVPVTADASAPLALYVSAYSPMAPVGAGQSYGGVYRSYQSQVGPLTWGRGTAGLSWASMLTGIRGNAIAVKRTSGAQPASIVVGRIQRTNADVGTDAPVAAGGVTGCGSPCSPSVYVSVDGGFSWAARTFAPSSPGINTGSVCPDTQASVPTSSKLVGNLSFDPINNNVVYAAANSGLWVSSDSGGTWTNAFPWCGNSPGVAVTAVPGSQRVYVGTSTGEIWTATSGPTGVTSAFTKIALGPGIPPSYIQTIMLDERDPSGRTLFAGSWPGASSGGVFKVLVDSAATTASTTDLKASFLDPYKDCLGIAPGCLTSTLLPYPLIFDPAFRSSLFLAQHPLAPDLLYASSLLGGVWTRSDGSYGVAPILP